MSVNRKTPQTADTPKPTATQSSKSPAPTKEPEAENVSTVSNPFGVVAFPPMASVFDPFVNASWIGNFSRNQLSFDFTAWTKGFEFINALSAETAQHFAKRLNADLAAVQAMASCKTPQELIVLYTKLTEETVQDYTEYQSAFFSRSMSATEDSAKLVAQQTREAVESYQGIPKESGCHA
ncbi:MAG: phasin family protein [Pseudomonadota bacterium]